jgi:uncharacterized protein YqeY
MSLKEQLTADLQDALRQRDEIRKTSIRLVIAAVKNGEIAAGKQFDDPEVLLVVAKQVKQRHESIEEFGKAGRQDLVDTETAELRVLEGYMPPSLSREEITEEARKVIAEVGARGPSDKGKVMSALMPKMAGRAEGRAINEIVTELLAGLS